MRKYIIKEDENTEEDDFFGSLVNDTGYVDKETGEFIGGNTTTTENPNSEPEEEPEDQSTSYENILHDIEDVDEFIFHFKGCRIPEFMKKFYKNLPYIKPQVFEKTEKPGYCVVYDKDSKSAKFPFKVYARLLNGAVTFSPFDIRNMRPFDVNVDTFYGSMRVMSIDGGKLPYSFPKNIVGNFSVENAENVVDFGTFPIVKGELKLVDCSATDEAIDEYVKSCTLLNPENVLADSFGDVKVKDISNLMINTYEGIQRRKDFDFIKVGDRVDMHFRKFENAFEISTELINTIFEDEFINLF